MVKVTGQIVWTAGVNEEIADNSEFAKFVLASLHRFARRDWGETSEEDKPLNDAAVKAWDDNDEDSFDRILAVYKKEGLQTIWIIAEWDRSVTTVLFPSEY